MSNTTKSGDTKLLVCVQTAANEIPATPTWYEIRGTGESAAENMETVESGEFNENNAVTEIENIGTDAQSPFNFRLCGDLAEEKIMEWALNGTLDASNVLKAANTEKYLAVRRVIYNDEGSFVTDTIGCKCASINFSIIAKQLHSVSVVPQGAKQIIRDVQLAYMAAGTANAIFGGHDSVWVNTADGKLYKRTNRAWATTASNASNAFTTGREWKAVAVDPAVTTGEACWILNTVNGKFFWDTGVALSVPAVIFTWLPSAWFNGTAAPASTVGGRNSMYLLTGDGTATTHANIYQKIFNGSEDVWTLVANFNLTALPETPWYASNTITAKSENALMKFPHLRDLVFTGVIGTKCVNDLSFTIENNLTPQHGACTDNIGKTWPNYGSFEVSRGMRKITGNFTSFFYNDELQKIRHAGKVFTMEFMIGNGTEAWRIIFPRLKFNAGEPNVPNATDAATMENYTFQATYEPDTYLTDMEMIKVDDIDDYPPLYYGWAADPAAVNLTTDTLESMTNYSGNYEVMTKPAGSPYFVICTPSTEPDITSLVNTDTNVDELSDYGYVAGTQELVTGITYKVLKTDNNAAAIPTAGEIFIINRDPDLAEV
jgi:hypothetical protein